MAICKIHFCLIMLIVSVGYVASTSDDYLTCLGIGDILAKCENYLSPVYGKTLVPPSGDCCAAIINADVGCLLKFLGPFKAAISREKLLFVNKFCIAPGPHGSNGSYKVQV
ncbi:hypothetical protein MKW94_026660 [Papaver nudicaule]|uniref:Bifunctional inhibitor/plant lipid transfer protein/seed storage helical domain-containing protein n=1 Tax=Papaver nudicaule TaxID=74823 RepID=A0AA42AY46_PAPNU|nr:hypothetical protein [Papaver nudicaule]